MRDEFEFIRNIKKKYGLDRIGDDCAVLPKDAKTDIVITADMLVEDIDFRLDWTKPELLGHKALAVSLSDVAAMGARALSAMLSIAAPRAIWAATFLDRFYTGWHQLASAHGVELVGGDISRISGKLVIDSVVIGEVPKGKAILRDGARPGDSIFVTGALGSAAGGLKLLRSRKRTKNSVVRRRLIASQLAPEPRVETARYLSRRGLATAMIDISDGLAADLHHICEASGVGARIDVDKLPIDNDLQRLFPHEARALAIAGGEDFELLFTSRQKKISSPNSLPVTRIGEITEYSGIVELISDDKVAFLPALGFKHF